MPPVTEKENLNEGSSETQNEEEIKEGIEEESEIVTEPAETEGEENEPKEFMNPNELPNELKPIFKKMQASFTRAMQGVAGDKKKIELYDNLMTNPETTIKNLAAQVGLKIVDGKAVEDSSSDIDESNETVKWIKKIVQRELAPQFKNFQTEQAQIKAQAGIAYLDKNHPDWYLYEDVMTELVNKHPTLGQDLDTLYEVSKQSAVKAVEAKRAATKTSLNITKPSKGDKGTVIVPAKAKTIDEALSMALKQNGMSRQ